MRAFGDGRFRPLRAGWAGLAGAGCALAFLAPALAQTSLAACKDIGTAFVTIGAMGARDGATIHLADGRELRLPGVIAPNDLDGDGEAARRATAALQALVAGKELALYGKADAKDRYGRLMAQTALADGRWVAVELVAAGMLRVAPEAGEPACTDSLLAVEREARAASRGLWADARFQVQKADAVAALLEAKGRFAVVEGTVRRVGETASRTFLDFGTRYTQDFTLVIPRAAREAFKAAGIDLKQMRGKRVRARGVLYTFGGPAIELRLPGALELVQDGT